MVPFGSQRSLPVVKGNGLFRAHFRATVGELNNTKSVGFILEGNPTRKVYCFLKRALPIKRLDFLTEAKENRLINRRIAFRPCIRVSVHFAVKSVLGSFSHGVSFSSKQAGQTEGRANLSDIHLDTDLSLFIPIAP